MQVNIHSRLPSALYRDTAIFCIHLTYSVILLHIKRYDIHELFIFLHFLSRHALKLAIHIYFYKTVQQSYFWKISSRYALQYHAKYSLGAFAGSVFRQTVLSSFSFAISCPVLFLTTCRPSSVVIRPLAACFILFNPPDAKYRRILLRCSHNRYCFLFL